MDTIRDNSGRRPSRSGPSYCRTFLGRGVNEAIPVERTTSNLQGLIPAMTEWVVEPGDKIRVFSPEGDPRDPSTDLSQAYLVPDPFVLQPSYMSGFITTDSLSAEEIDQLEHILCAKMPITLISKVERALEEFVCTIALQGRLATWKEIENQLKVILETCAAVISSAEALIRLTDPKVLDGSAFRGALSADQLIKKMLMEIPSQHRIILNIDLSSVISLCDEAYRDVQSKTKRGRKPEAAFRLLLSRLTSSMKEDGFEIKLPSNENIFDKTHSTFVFLCSVLDLCSSKGRVAVLQSSLDADEKTAAIKALSHYRKSPRAVLHYFRDGSLA